MEELLKIYRDNNELDFDKIWKEGIFFFDTNVILDLYRLPTSAKDDLIKILENKTFNPRIWLPFQVLLEFLNNRQDVIRDQKIKYSEVTDILDNTVKEYNDLMEKLTSKLNKLKLEHKHSSINPSEYINTTNSEKGIEFIKEFKTSLSELQEKQKDINHKDELKDEIFSIFKDKIGVVPTSNLDDFYKDGEERFKNNIPPGYEDKSKDGFYMFQNNKYIRKYGDLFLWKQIIEKVKNENIKYAVLVTGDSKDDWIHKVKGHKVGIRRELLDEIYTEVPNLDTFHIYDTSNFLNFARQYLDSTIKEESVAEAKELINTSKNSVSLAQRGYWASYLDVITIIHELLVELSTEMRNIDDYFMKTNSELIKDIIIGINDFNNRIEGIKNVLLLKTKQGELLLDLMADFTKMKELLSTIGYIDARMKRDSTPYYNELFLLIKKILLFIYQFEEDINLGISEKV